MLVLFAVIERKLLVQVQAGLEKLKADLLQLSGIRYDLRSLSVSYLVSLAYWERIDFLCLVACFCTPQAI